MASATLTSTRVIQAARTSASLQQPHELKIARSLQALKDGRTTSINCQVAGIRPNEGMPGIVSLGLRIKRRESRQWRRKLSTGQSRGGATSAVATLDNTRLIDFLRSIPDRSNEYFKPLWRRGMWPPEPFVSPSICPIEGPTSLHLPSWGGVSLFGGFYVANTISLSLGANSVNDVIAAAVCTWFTEYVTKYYYSRNRATFLDALLNTFKIGLQYGLFCDAFKLAS